MKTVLVVTLLVSSAFAQSPPIGTAVAPGCGADDAKLEVKTEQGKHPAAQPDAGKALVYFVEDDSEFASTPKPTTRAGLDGTWVGATHGNSYFYFSVDPGEHHLCASWQSSVIIGRGHMAAAAHFTAAAGGVYYFEVKNIWASEPLRRSGETTLTPLDSDEGQLLASRVAFSTSHPQEKRGQKAVK
jgi:hypothetical protein